MFSEPKFFDEPVMAESKVRSATGVVALAKKSFAGRFRLRLTDYALGAGVAGAVLGSFAAAPGISGLLGGALAITMIAIAVVDARSFTIPDKLVLVGLLLGFADAAVVQHPQFAAGLLLAAMRGLVITLVFFAGRAAYRRIRKREGIGLGDVKLVAVAGVWLNWTSIAVAIDLAAFSALAAVLIYALRGRQIAGTSAIPFGLFFAPAIWLAWLFDAIGKLLLG